MKESTKEIRKICLFFFFLPQSMWDLSFPIKDQTHGPCLGSTVLTTKSDREIPGKYF